ncbi:hypothetical protein AAG747_28865 [Rapidithrix thailandica]|uniref:Transposase n=1 Tax=Rapidithrix thailandica TaxID=413964 RepID=A0AAW9SMH7_9BACT
MRTIAKQYMAYPHMRVSGMTTWLYLDQGIPKTVSLDGYPGDHSRTVYFQDIKRDSSQYDGKGRATDNAFTERLWRNIKYKKTLSQPSKRRIGFIPISE